MSTDCTIAQTAKIGISVQTHKIRAIEKATHHEKALSNKKVIKVFPPARIVKYNAFKTPCTGKKTAVMIIK